MPWRQTPSRKKKDVVFTAVTTSAYQDQLNAGFSKVCDIFKVRSIESLKYVREFYTSVCYCDDISTPQNVKQPHGRALANESYHGFQTFIRQSEGLATRDYTYPNPKPTPFQKFKYSIYCCTVWQTLCYSDVRMPKTRPLTAVWLQSDAVVKSVFQKSISAPLIKYESK